MLAVANFDHLVMDRWEEEELTKLSPCPLFIIRSRISRILSHRSNMAAWSGFWSR